MTSEEIRKITPYHKTHYGSEGTVFENGELAIKLFKEINGEEFMTRKEIKTLELLKKEIKGFITPNDIILNKKGEFKGYTMKLIKYQEDVADVCYKNAENYSLDKKIEYLLKIEQLIKNAHNQEFILNDCAIWNFLIDGNNVLGIDTDNFEFNGLKSDTLPKHYLEYYQDLTKTKKTTYDSDKFQFGLHAIRALMKYPFSHEGSFVCPKTNESEYLKIKFKNLDVSKEILDELLDLISTKKEKQWIGKTLKKLSSSTSKFIN